MNILILNGSPSGDSSITLQTVLYLQKLYPEHEYARLNVGQRIKSLEKDFSPAREALEKAELLLFCYPVYTFLAPAQLHRFLELVRERRICLSGKYAAQITTSKHFYDVTAHRFIKDSCADLGLVYLGGLSADMDDLLKEKGQKEARTFFHHTLWAAMHDFAEPAFAPAASGAPLLPASVPEAPRPKKKEGRISVVTDLDPEDTALAAMIDRFTAVSPYECTVVNLHGFAFAGGCLGCFHCASDGTCIYKDGFDRLLRENIQTADATVYAYTVRDHSMGSRFKYFDDRQFCNGHRTVTMGKPVGYLVNGHLSAEPNLQMLMEARAQVGGNHLAGIAGNESSPDPQIDRLAAELSYAVRHGYSQPKNFYGVGGLKIFRDLIWQMQGMMREDHRFYKKHGFYDFPQKKKGTVAGMYLVGAMMRSKMLKKKLGPGAMTKGMLMPYEKVIKDAKGI